MRRSCQTITWGEVVDNVLAAIRAVWYREPPAELQRAFEAATAR
jgi:hypothetical protein